jgi:hypothetical protein
VAALRAIRDDLLATTVAGREWIALFERAQFALLSAAVRDAKLLAEAGELIRAAARLVGDKDAVFDEADSKRASSLLKKLRVKVKTPALQSDLDAVGARIEQLSGRRTQQVIESLMRQKPAKRGKTVAAKKKRTPARKRARQRR